MKILQTNIKSFSCIIQCADIHIRLQKRHDEYRQVFGEFYSLIDKSPVDTVVCIVGDLLHAKIDLQPECIQLTSDFLKTIADKRPTVLIAGNHDGLLNNKDRMDSLSPIVNALNHSNLYYLRESGLYILGDILFNNMSVFDDYQKYTLAKDIPRLYRNQTRHLISLYHGTIDNVMTDGGHTINNKMITPATFDGHDIALCGDIHKAQTIYIEKEVPNVTMKLDTDWTTVSINPDTNVLRQRKNNPIIRYCGSICQQDHGESLDNHGCTIWNLKGGKYVHIDLPNDYGFFTIQINKGKLATDITNIPKKVRLRVLCLETVATEVKAVLGDIKKVSEVIESVYIRLTNEKELKNSIAQATTLNLTSLASVEYQNKLIETFIKKKFVDDVITPAQFSKIFEINKEYNGKIDKDNLTRNIRWKPKKLEFSNMFSYGENNVIDFTNLNGVVGLFAPNSAGKSSTLDILSFCLYDKCSKSFKASHILNSQKMSFKCKFNFEISGVDFFVERCGTADKKGNVKVDVKFYKDVGGKIKELNGEARRSTNDIIRDCVGSYDDFILTVLSVQNNKSGTFIDMGPTERKDLLSQFMGLNMFGMLYDSSSKKLNEIEVLLKEYNISDKNQSDIILEYEERIANLTNKFKNKSQELENLQINRTSLNSNIIELNKGLLDIEKDIPKNVETLESEKMRLMGEIEEQLVCVTLDKSTNTKNELELESLNQEIKSLTDKNVIQLYKDFQALCETFDDEVVVLDKKKIVIQSKLDKIEKLKNHRYDPNCKFCVDNEFVKDAEDSKLSLVTDKSVVDSLLVTHRDTQSKIDGLKHVEELYSKYISLDKKRSALEKEISKNTSVILRLESALAKNNAKLEDTTAKIVSYYNQKDAIEHNNKVETQIGVLNGQIRDIDSTIKQDNSELMRINTDLTSHTTNKQTLISELETVKKLEIEQKAYKYYVTAVSRDGIPFELISQAIPIIEKEVNEILHQVVEFGVNIQTDGKNVMTYIVKDNKKWPLELAGGMEKFLSGLALRVALINVSNLPKPNFIAVDEGWGTMDAENLSAVSALFSILKGHFDFIWIISHLDSMRDFVNTRLEIVKENGFSKINYK